LEKVEKQIEGLEEIKESLLSLIKKCEENDDAASCPLIKTLHTSED
jgi:hypothetical protein